MSISIICQLNIEAMLNCIQLTKRHKHGSERHHSASRDSTALWKKKQLITKDRQKRLQEKED